MKDFKRRRRHDITVYANALGVFLLILAGFLAVSVYERYQVEREVAERRAEAEAERAALEERRAVLEARVKELSGERGVETEIRRNFDVAKEGETVVVILDDDTVEAAPTLEASQPAAVVESMPWYQFW